MKVKSTMCGALERSKAEHDVSKSSKFRNTACVLEPASEEDFTSSGSVLVGP